MAQNIPKPPYDPELIPLLKSFPPLVASRDIIPALRKAQADAATLETTIAGLPFTHEERSVPGPNGPVTLSIFHPKDSIVAGKSPCPAIYNLHMGGMICGTRFSGLREPLSWVQAVGGVCISAEYRQAPEHPFPAALEDSYAGLAWIGSHLQELNIDPDRLMVSGQSAGGSLAAAMALLSRDRKGPRLCAQLLDSGMFDDRTETVSCQQYMDEGLWTGAVNKMAWDAFLGPNAGHERVSPYAAVVRTTDLSNLPPAYVTVGAAEIFRDENMAYAQKLFAAGVPTELHVWPGGYHCFDMMVPDAAVSKASLAAKLSWVKKALGSSRVTPKL
ncbi:unnamed protein product [Clonostachys rosea]|uniref:Alpha/beta hydrolase fold-3 domain-containing protein n=1 Tax=Bionectria ochroleuca TaxID=29856 RepID=A0ABY6US37_BIOOC|nr:unnamed protein product [Clonostachys rosea]